MLRVSSPQLREEVCQLFGCYAETPRKKKEPFLLAVLELIWFKVGSTAEMEDCGAEYQLLASEL